MLSLLLPLIYVAFISLGLPDAVTGAAWPVMQPALGVPLSFAGIISFTISIGTVISSLQSDRLTKRYGTGAVTVTSVALTAIGLLGFSFSPSFLFLLIFAVPYGLGAGSIDAALNNFVALHYESRHMSWLHCMWGVGAALGPYIMGLALSSGAGWRTGYRSIGLFQVLLFAILLLSLPLWKKASRFVFSRPNLKTANAGDAAAKDASPGRVEDGASGRQSGRDRYTAPLTLRQIIRIPGAAAVMIAFFGYCAIETTTGLWASSFLTYVHHVEPEMAANFGAMFFIGITVGRGVSGFITYRLSDRQMIYMGFGVICAGLLLLLAAPHYTVALTGLLLVGLGCAPIYPCIIHSTPDMFGADRSQAIIGVEMASAYVGTSVMPPLFGLLAQHLSVSLFPAYLLLLLLLMAFFYKRAATQVRLHF